MIWHTCIRVVEQEHQWAHATGHAPYPPRKPSERPDLCFACAFERHVAEERDRFDAEFITGAVAAAAEQERTRGAPPR